MPDDASGKGKKEQSTQNVPQPQAAHAPPPPDHPLATPAQSVPEKEMEAEVKILENRVTRAESLMIRLTGGIVLLTLGLVIVGILQWNAMRGQLGEMQGQNTLARQQLEGTMGATLSLMLTDIQPQPFGSFQIHIANAGHVAARDVNTHITVGTWASDGTESHHGVGCYFKQEQLEPGGDANPDIDKRCSLKGLGVTQKDWESLKRFETIIRFEVALSYFNGFNRLINAPTFSRCLQPIGVSPGDPAQNKAPEVNLGFGTCDNGFTAEKTRNEKRIRDQEYQKQSREP